jgi:caffeoyl-CoA O-methyltransferase
VARSTATGGDTAIAEYLAAHARQDEVLAEIDRTTRDHPRASMQVSPDQGALLTLLARITNATNALEIGSFFGYSAICIARGLATGGTLTCLEIDPDYAAAACENLERAGVADRVTIVEGDAAETLAATDDTPTYDFVFLDADKQGYADYYELVLPRTKPGGLILVDNTLLSGRVLDPQDQMSQTVADLNDRIANDDRVDSAMALVADGLTFVRKR